MLVMKESNDISWFCVLVSYDVAVMKIKDAKIYSYNKQIECGVSNNPENM